MRLLYVGRIVRTKGLRDVIAALAALTDLDLALDVVGDGNDRQNCEELADRLGVAERVSFHGRLPRESVDDFYAAADIFVFPSYREPGGNVSLEAMSFGLPLIVCERGGPGANVTDACAIRLAARTPQQLAADVATSIRALVGDVDRRLAMGLAAREHAQAAHLWSDRLARMEQVYDEVRLPSAQ